MADILVLYYSRGGSVAALARQIARGIGEVDGMAARLRTVPPVAARTEVAMPPVPESGAPYVSGCGSQTSSRLFHCRIAPDSGSLKMLQSLLFLIIADKI